MTWQRFVQALLWAMIALLASFFLINVLMIAWYTHTDPHDGQGGLAAMMWAFIVAPVCGLVTLRSFCVAAANAQSQSFEACPADPETCRP